MKRVVALILVVLVLTLDNAPAQMRRLRERRERLRAPGPPSALKVVGISSIAIGGAGALFGSYDYLVGGNNGGSGHDPLGIKLMAVGGGLVVAGICLLVIDHNRNGIHHRFSIASPKRNEIGVAYNF